MFRLYSVICLIFGLVSSVQAASTTFTFHNSEVPGFDFAGHEISSGFIEFELDLWNPGEQFQVTLGTTPGGAELSTFQMYNDQTNDYVFTTFSDGFAGVLLPDVDNFYVQITDVVGTVSVNRMRVLFTENGRAYSFNGGIISAVPEPASWLMMILGFGVVSVARKRRENIRRILSA